MNSVVERLEGWLLIKRGLYWRPDSQGYTGIKDHAGRYPFAEAEDWCSHSDDITMVHEDDAPEFSSACFQDTKLTYPLNKIIASQAAEIERLTKLVSSSEAERYRSCSELLERAETAGRLLAEATGALGFYGDVSKYPAPLTGGMGDLWLDCGQIARTTLAALQPKEAEQ